MEFEIIEIECERSVRCGADQPADLIRHRRPAITGQAHHFVLAFVYRETEVCREGRIQHAERMRKPDFTHEVYGGNAARVPFAVADGQSGPFADAIGGQDGSAASWRGEKRGGG